MSTPPKNPIELLWQETRDLTQIDRLPSPPSPLAFLRRHVSQNKPCLVSNAVPHWPALSLWSHSDDHLIKAMKESLVSVHLTPDGRADAVREYSPLSDSLVLVHLKPDGRADAVRDGVFVEYSPLSDSLVSVHLTPDGRADAVRDGVFVEACVERVGFEEALEMVYESGEGVVAYGQQQNDCFRSEYSPLSGDCESHIPWASEALGCLPEAVNFWIGNECSETSFHKDHYENLYAVVTGEKHFLLLPPTDVHRMYIRDYPAAKYCFDKGTQQFTCQLEDPVKYVPWSSVDPYPLKENREREMTKFPLYFNGPKPFEVTVKAGEILYLPSMWFHHVRQSPDSRGRTIAVNYWYDMQFDIKYAYFNFLQSIPYSTIQKMSCLDSSSGSSITDAGEELDTTAVVDNYSNT